MNDKEQKRFMVKGFEKKEHFSNCFLNSTATDGRLMAFNDKYLALAYIGKGNIKILDFSKPINLINNYSTIKLEEPNILDMEFSPFDSNLLCFSNDNSNVFLSKITYKTSNEIELNSKVYKGHKKKVNFINFNPIASNIMVSGTSYGDIHIWESKEFKTYMQFKLSYNPNSLLWSPHGDLIGITTKNKFLTIYDPRNRKAVFQEQISNNWLITKFAWLDNNSVATVSINSDNKKVLSLLDIRKYNENNNYFSELEINQYTTLTIPYVNPELKLIYCVGKDESAIKIFDYCTGSLKTNNEFKASEANNCSVFLNRQYLNKSKMEVDRFARYTKNRNIFYVSFNLIPGQNFDGILYPDTEFAKPQMDSNDWIIGKKFEHIPTRLYQKKISQKNNSNEKDNLYLTQFVNLEKKIPSNREKYSNNNSKDNNSKNSQQVNYEDLYKELEKENKALSSKLLELQNSLKEKENENKLEINKYKKLIQEKEQKILEMKNDSNQKEERSSKNIATLISQINEKKLLLQSKDMEISKLKDTINNKDNTIKEYKAKIQSLENENKKYLEEKNHYQIILKENEDKIQKLSLMKEELKKKYEDEIYKKIELINNQYKENALEELNKTKKNLIKTLGINLKNLKDKYDDIYSTKEVELNQKCKEILKLNIHKLTILNFFLINKKFHLIFLRTQTNINEKEIYYNKINEENINLKKEISRFPFSLSENEYIILLIIITKDEKVMFPLISKNTDNINKLKEIFFKEFPEYSQNKGIFYKRNKNNLLKSDKTLEECNIKYNDIIIFESE